MSGRGRAVRVRFVGVGRAKRSWAVDVASVHRDDIDHDGVPSRDWMAAQAAQALQSSVIDVVGEGDRLRIVVGGWRSSGAVVVERVEPFTPSLHNMHDARAEAFRRWGRGDGESGWVLTEGADGCKRIMFWRRQAFAKVFTLMGKGATWQAAFAAYDERARA